MLIDNNSTDKCLEIIKDAASSDERIVPLSEKTQGVAAARNCGIDAASGDYLCFIDADDIVDESMLFQLNEILSRSSADIAVFGIECWYADKDVVLYTAAPAKTYTLSGKKLKETAQDIFFLSTPSMCTKAFKTSLIRQHNLSVNTNLKSSEDMLFSYSAMMYVNSIVFIDKILYKYRQEVKDSLSSAKKYQGTQIFDAMKLLDKVAKKTKLYKKYHSGVLNLVLDQVTYYLRRACNTTEFCELYNAFVEQWWEEISKNANAIRDDQQEVYDSFKKASDAQDLIFEQLQESRTLLLWYEKQCRKLEGDIETLKANNEHKIQELTGTKAYKVGNAIMKPFCKLKDKLAQG